MIFRFWSTAYVRHMEAEIEWLRTQALKSEQRANIAVAELVRLQTGGNANVHPQPLMAEREQDLTKELSDLRQDPEWSRAGE